MHNKKQRLNRREREREKREERGEGEDRQTGRQADWDILVFVDGGTLLDIQVLGGKT